MIVVITGVSAAWSQRPGAVPLHFRESVTLDTDSNVAKKLGTVTDYLSEEQWAQAVDVLQDISEKHGQSLIAVAPGQYANVAVHCNRILAGLPVEGLAVYRERIDPRARQWFEEGSAQRDENLLTKVVHHAFVSSYGDDALLLLGELAWERGNVSAARDYWTQLIPLDRPHAPGDPVPVLRYPDSDFSRAEVLARLALCSRLQGNTARADAELRAFRQMHPHAEGTLAGRTGNLADILTAVAESSEQWNIPSPESAATTFALNAQRNAALPKAVDVGAKQWSVPLPENPYEVPNAKPALRDRGPLSYFPVVFGDVVLVNSAEKIFAYDVHTGRPAWPSGPDEDDAAIYTTVAGRTGAMPNLPVAGVPRYTMTVSEGRLYARMGAPVTERGRHEFRASSELVCLDLARGEGKLLWHVSAEQMALDDEKQAGPQWTFEGSPVVQNGRAYVVLRRTRPNTQLNVACLETETGKILWNRKVVSTVANVDEAYNFASHHLLTLAQNRIFYATDTGAVAALDAADGTLRWVVTYESQSRGDHAALSDHMKQGLLPCLFHQGTVFVAPNDSNTIMALGAETGLTKWSRELPDRVRHLLGVGEGQLIVSGNSLWALDVETGAVRWRQGFNDPDGYGYGRGLLVDQLVYWPTREEIFIVEQKAGTLRRRVALRALHREYGGNLTITDGVLLVAQPDRLVAFGEFGFLREKDEKELSANPQAAQPHWRLAKFDLVAGNAEAAALHFQRAAERATVADRVNGRPLREVAARHGRQILQTRAREARQRGDPAAAIEALQSAVALARKPADRLECLATLAQSHLANDDPTAAIAVLQSILQDRELAKHPFPTHHSVSNRRAPDGDGLISLENPPSRFVVPNLIAIVRHGRPADFFSAPMSQSVEDTAHATSPAAALPAPLSRAWTRNLGRHATVCVPDGQPPSSDRAGLLVDDEGLHWIAPHDGNVRWSVTPSFPLVRAFHFKTHLLVATSRALLALTYETGDVLWRKPLNAIADDFRQDLKLSADHVAQHDGRVFVYLPEHGVWAFDAESGTRVWNVRRHTAGLSSRWLCDDRHIVLQTQGPDRTLVLETSSGRLVHVAPSSQSKWRSDPVRIASDRFAVVTETGKIQSFTAKAPAETWTYEGPFSQANARPVLLAHGKQLAAVIDGDTLAGLDRQTGKRLWSRGLGPVPLVSAQDVSCLDGTRLFIASTGIVRCYELNDGGLYWEQFLGTREGRWRVVKQGDVLVAYPVNGLRDAAVPVVVLEAATGRKIQKLQLHGPATRIDTFALGQSAVVCTDGQMMGLRPFTPNSAIRTTAVP